MAIKIYPYKQGSRSAKALANELGCRVLKKVGSKYRRREGDLIINWGAGDSPFKGAKVANQPESIINASNKLTCFKLLKDSGVRTPDFTEDQEEAERWAAGGTTVMCRTLLQANSGKGIVVAEKAADVVRAPLYTKYVKKKDEYRIHVLRKPGKEPEVISVQRKAKRHDAEDVDFKIRNLANGFVFVREGVVPPDDVSRQAIEAVKATGLAFGAVDVVWNEHLGQAFVLEVNTAPGLEGQTVEDYANAFAAIAN
jgi:glutathione synthase/RimK-type ligase-like ATP-grasp enzyme